MDNMNDHSKLEVKQKQIAQRIANSLLKGANVPFSLEKRDLVARIIIELAPSHIIKVATSKKKKKNSSIRNVDSHSFFGTKKVSIRINKDTVLHFDKRDKSFQPKLEYVGEIRGPWAQKRGPRNINYAKLKSIQLVKPLMTRGSVGMARDLLQYDNAEEKTKIPKSWKSLNRDDFKKKIMDYISKSKYRNIKGLAEYLGINPVTISRMWSEEGRTELKIIVAVCIALEIPSSDASNIIKDSGYVLRNTPTERMYKALLFFCEDGDVLKCNELLDALGCDLLPCAKPEELKEN